jgi:hypothetical protein
VPMLTVVESHSVLLLGRHARNPCAEAYSVSRWQGRAE